MATYTAEIKSSSQLTGSIMMSVNIEVKKDGVFDHDKELDVKAASYQDGIKEYLREFKEAQDAFDAVQEGEVITLD